MAQVLTPKINLKKDDDNEKIIDLRSHVNENFDILDTTVGQAVAAIANLKSLLGQLGLDENGNPVVSKANALSTIGAAPKGNGSYSSLAAAEQAIADTNTRIDGISDSVSKKEIIYNALTLASGFEVNIGTTNIQKRGNFAWFNWSFKVTSVPSGFQTQLGTLASNVRPDFFQSLLCDSAKSILDIDVYGVVTLTRNGSVHPNAYSVGEVLWLRGMYPIA